MIINKLYSALVSDITNTPGSSTTYKKVTSPVLLNNKAKSIKNIIMPSSEAAERQWMFACCICNKVLKTRFGAEILQLDVNNTYSNVGRLGLSTSTVASECMHDLTHSSEYYNNIKTYIDSDIKDRLDTCNWLDLMGAACLQILRGVE